MLGQRFALQRRKILLRARRGNSIGQQNNVLMRRFHIGNGVIGGLHCLINLRTAIRSDLVNQGDLAFQCAGRPQGNHPIERFIK